MTGSSDDELNDLLRRMQAEYLESVPEKIQKIQEARASGDLKRLRTEFHRLRGSGKTFGFPEITRLGESLERIIDRCQEAERERAVDLALALLAAFGKNKGGSWSLEEAPEWVPLSSLIPAAA